VTTGKQLLPASSDATPVPAPRALRILVGDDDRDATLTLATILRDEGHQVRTVYGGRQVMPAVIEFGPQVVILDLHMPDVSGWQIATAIRARIVKPPLLIAITGYYTKGADRILSELTGFDHYMVKPFDPGVLLKLMEPLRSADP
jgi:DNA-binding response OmpR family regulator